MHSLLKVQREYKRIKKKLSVENLFKYELEVFIFKFVNDFLPHNFKCYFKNINNIHIIQYHLTCFSKTLVFTII